MSRPGRFGISAMLVAFTWACGVRALGTSAPEAAQPFQAVGPANVRFQAAMGAAQVESAKADQGSNVPTYCLFTGITY